jgi:ribosomal protein L37AE/L43A
VTDACPGSCNTAWRATGQGDPWPGEPVWCQPCKARIRAALADIDDMLAELARQADGHHGQQDTTGRRSANAPSPSVLFDETDEAVSTLLAWEDAWIEQHPEWTTRPRRGRHTTIERATISQLIRHLDGILEAPFAADFGREILSMRHRLASVGHMLEPPRLPVECPRCGLRMLEQVEPGHWMCAHCRRPMDEAEIQSAGRSLGRAG